MEKFILWKRHMKKDRDRMFEMPHMNFFLTNAYTTLNHLAQDTPL
jgi:hypothetical protein